MTKTQQRETYLASLRAGDTIGGHPNPTMRRAERAIVRALRDEGFGPQSQVTLPDRVEIAAGGIVVIFHLDSDTQD